MEANQQTIQQIERAIRKVAAKFARLDDPVLTDIYLQVKPESGEILAFDDEDRELHRCVVEEWIDNTQEDFYVQVAPLLCQCINRCRETVDTMQVMRPFSFVLIDEEHETIQDLVYIDNEDTVILDSNLLKGVDEELDAFLKHLLEED